MLARRVEQDWRGQHPGDSLFLLLAPNARRFPQPLLLDRRQRQCIWLSPAALYDNTERGFGLSTTAQGFKAMLVESQGLALLKNPFPAWPASVIWASSRWSGLCGCRSRNPAFTIHR